MKTMLQVVSELSALGHNVDYYVRKDGGILIRRIDQKTFKGAKGNAEARQIVGAPLSEARSYQLKFATRARSVKHLTLDEEVKKEWKKVKTKWNKAFKAKDGKPHPAGYFGWARITRAIKEYGKEEALRRIHEAERYATGIAYSKNVRILFEFILDASKKYKSKELEGLADDILLNAYSIKEEWLNPAYSALYKLNAGQSPKEVAKNIRRILRL